MRSLPEFLHPAANHILDWFHITMRLTVVQQCVRSLPVVLPDLAGIEVVVPVSFAQRLEGVKHFLWHGNVANALDRLRFVRDELECWGYDDNGKPCPHAGAAAATRVLTATHELETYLMNNAGSIVKYGERYQNGERISTGFVESMVNYVVSKRMVKKQQMQWTPLGAHLLL